MAERICTVAGCDRKYLARGWCQLHYHRWWDGKHKTYKRPTMIERLAARSTWVETTRSADIGDCLVWTGVRTKDGYGTIGSAGQNLKTHRAAWVARHGEIPAETPCVLHRCDNPPCWRDDHLFLGTKADNAADMIAKGRYVHHGWTKTHCLRGHPFDAVNTRYVAHGTARQCRPCERIRIEKRKARASAEG